MPKPNETEEAISETLDKRMDFTDGDDTTTTPASTEEAEAEPASSNGVDESQPAVEVGTVTDPSAAPATKDASQPVPAEARPVEQAATPHPSFKNYNVDAKGNVVDGTGTVVATNGRERRWFEASETMRGYIDQQQRYTVGIEAKLREALESGKNALDGVPTRLGLSREETDLGLKLAANFKSNPVETAKYILAETMKLGYDIKEIAEMDGPNSINMRAITQLIDEKLAPFTTQAQERKDAQTNQDEGQRAYQEFMSRFPDAAPHQDAIAGVAKEYNLSPERAYFELKIWAAKNGLDFSRPLHEQRAKAPAATPSTTAPLPSGGSPAAIVTDTPQIASEDESYESIIKGAMRDAGMAT